VPSEDAVSHVTADANVTERQVTVSNPLGVHARPAAMIVQTATRFQSEIWLIKDGRKVNGKSMLGVMVLMRPKRWTRSCACLINASTSADDDIRARHRKRSRPG